MRIVEDEVPAPGEWVFHACNICGSPIYYEPQKRVTCARCQPLVYAPPAGWLEKGAQ